MVPILAYVANILNLILSNSWTRALLFVVSTVFIGYTLQPIPDSLNRLFNTSTLFKFGVIVVCLACTAWPMSDNDILMILVISALTLYVFELMRTGTKYLPMREINYVTDSVSKLI